MRYVKCVLAALLVLAFTGCSPVYVPTPLGEEPACLKAEEWDGTWQSTEGSVVMKVTDSEKGLLRITEDTGNLEFESLDVLLRTSGDWMFGSVKDEESKDVVRYLWARVKRDEGQVILWLPDTEKFKGLVSNGTLPGKVEGDEVHLGELSAAHLAILTSSSQGVLLNWENPLVLIRMADWGK